MSNVRRIAVVTGTRADFGLLRPVIDAIRLHTTLELDVVVTGTHLIGATPTVAEVEAAYPIAARIPMQAEGATGRAADAAAFARGCVGFAEYLFPDPPDVVVVLGDRIEAFAAASVASVGGVRVAHLHGGDRAVGVADDALRHAISKLSHIHCAATCTSVERLLYLGELPATVHLVGSPAIDDLYAMPPMPEDRYAELGAPQVVLMLHPVDESHDDAWANMDRLIRLCTSAGRTLILEPNHDSGRAGLQEAIEQSGARHIAHLPRPEFVGLLRRADVLVGNSSAGLIECAALGVRCINIGLRQDGRERAANVIDVPDWDFGEIDLALEHTVGAGSLPLYRHPYGDGTCGPTVAELLAEFDERVHTTCKRLTY